jgi:hypothetical protein
MAALRILSTMGILITAAVCWNASRRSECGFDAAQARLTLGDHAGLASMLRANPALAHSRDVNGQTLLHSVAAGNDIAAARLLLAAGADVNARDQFDETPLHMAAMGSPPEDRVPLAEMLLTAGADVDATDSGGRTALHTAAIFVQKRLIVSLQRSGADAALPDRAGHTPVQVAVDAGMTWPAGSDDANTDSNGVPHDVILATKIGAPAR